MAKYTSRAQDMHSNGQPRHRFRRSQGRSGIRSCGRPGQSEGNSCLDEPPRLASGPGDCGSTRRKDGRSVAHGLEFFIGPAPMRPIIRPTRRSSGVVAGITERVPSGYGLPYDQFGFHGLRIDQPSLIESVNTGPINDGLSFMGQINLHFPKCDKHGAIKFHWYEGKVGNNGKDNKGVKNLPPMELFHGQNPKNSGLLCRFGWNHVFTERQRHWMVTRAASGTSAMKSSCPSKAFPKRSWRQRNEGRTCQGHPCRKARNRRIEFRLCNMTEAILLGNAPCGRGQVQMGRQDHENQPQGR